MKNSDLLKFIGLVGRLKKIKRKGWLKRKIPNPESVAEHSFRTSILALILAKKLGIEKGGKFLKMALIHDLGEALVGDIAPNEEKSNRKRALEGKAFAKLSSLLENEEKKEILDLWREFEEGKSKEARLVRELDKLEMAIQAKEYEREYSMDLKEFVDSAKKRIKNNELKKILEKFL